MATKDPEILTIDEFKKRRRERWLIASLAVLFSGLIYLEIHISSLSQKLPFVNSIFFFGLVNFNLVLLLFLMFMIFRNVAKVFSEKRGGMLGSRLKTKLVMAFVSFAFVPTILLFLVSVFYINSSFDKWFSLKIGSVLADSLEITNAFFTTTKKKNYHFAYSIAREIESVPAKMRSKRLRDLREKFSLDAVEYYPALFSDRQIYLSQDRSLKDIPAATLEFLQKGLVQGVEASTMHQFSEGNLIRCIVPVRFGNSIKGALIVSSYLPLSLISKMDGIALAYEDYRDVNPLKYPIKSIYLVILILVTLLILFSATWFGFHLARQLSTPLEVLGKATEEIAHGKYKPVDIRTGSLEMFRLVKSFNQMISDLSKSQDQLKAHTRYIEVIVSNISAGVISIDPSKRIVTINKYASSLLGIDPQLIVGQKVEDVLSREHRQVFDDLIGKLQRHKAHSIQKEFQVDLRGERLVLQATLSPLKDDRGKNLGFVLVFDDLTKLINAQRAAAWREVARRIAHEIKNPLTPIRLSAERLQKKFSDQINDPAFGTCTSTIIQQVDDLKNLVNEFSSFARLPQAQPVQNDLNKIIRENLVLYKEGHKDIEFKEHLDSNVPVFDLDREQIKRVLFNLLENAVAAIKSMPKSPGKIEVATQYDPVLKIVRMSVTDTGPGVSKDIRERIFDPYFSTKDGGSGLGLAIVKRIVDDHSGFVRFYNNVPHGCRFVIELPALTRLARVEGDEPRFSGDEEMKA